MAQDFVVKSLDMFFQWSEQGLSSSSCAMAYQNAHKWKEDYATWDFIVPLWILGRLVHLATSNLGM
jgi:hypothetical protein